MQDGKNLIMAIVLCLLVVVGWSYLADYMGWVVKPDPAEIAKMEAAQAEQAQLKERTVRGRKKLADEEQLVRNARQWAEVIREYADITELDAATLHRLVKEIVVHEQIDAGNTRHVTIEIYFNLKPIAATKPVTA